MELKPGYRQTEVGIIPNDWEVLDLSDLCTLQRGFDITEATKVSGTIPVYSSSGLSYFHNKAMVAPPGVVTGRKGMLGKVFFIEEPFWPHDTTLWVKDFKGNHAGYVALVLKNFHLERLDAATSVPTLNRNNLAGNRIPYTRNEVEQKAIFETLSDSEASIESLKQLIDKKRDLKQGAMQELLTGKKRLPNFSREWVVKRLGKLAQLYQPVTISADVFVKNGYPVYGANGVVGYYSDFNHESWQVTVTCRGSTCGTVNKTVDRCWITGNAMVVNCEGNNQINKAFLYYLLASQDLSSCITGTGQPQIVRTPLAELNLNIPNDIEEQRAIAAVLSDMDAELAALEERRDKTRMLKHAMAQELLTGRTRLVSPKEAHV